MPALSDLAVVINALTYPIEGNPKVIVGINPSGVPVPIAVDVDGKMKIAGTLQVSDIQIGAVELKDGTTDTRAKIAALTAITSADNGLPVADPLGNTLLTSLLARFASTPRTISIATVTTSGSVTAGKVGIEFIFSSDFVGTIGGVAFTGAADASWSPPPLQKSDNYAALTYTISAGSARLTTLA